MESPFVFGKIAKGSSFVNRNHELKQLGSNFTSGINTMIISPRRWGKSSLVARAAGQVERKHRDMRICQLDLFRVRDEDHFYEIFVQAVLKASSGRWLVLNQAGCQSVRSARRTRSWSTRAK